MKKKVTRSIGRTRDLPALLAKPPGTGRPPPRHFARAAVQYPGGPRRAQLAWVPVRSGRESNRPGSTP